MAAATPTDIAPDILVGRQAILDRDQNLHAYELLYRDARNDQPEGWQASSRTLLNTFMEIGIDRVAGPNRVFINLTREFFTELPRIPFDRERIVLEILEDIPVDDALIEAVRQLRNDDYTVAIDDYGFESKWEPLLPLVQIIKVDITLMDIDQIGRRLDTLRRHDLILLAEKVETLDQFRRLRRLGFDLFQGFFFARPQIVPGRRLNENHAVMLRLLARINDPKLDLDELEQLVAQDPALSFKTLRYVNSSAVAFARKIDSIRQAVIVLGIDRIRAWATLLVLSGVPDKPQEAVHTGIVRAHFCDRLIRESGGGQPEIAYTVGLLSVLDALMDIPLPDALDELPLPAAIKEAILDHAGAYGEALATAIAMERADWENPLCQRFPADRLRALYVDSTADSFAAIDAL